MKAQMISFDMVISVVMFIVFTSLFIGLIFTVHKNRDQKDFRFELAYVMDNFENNLAAEGYTFFKDYKIIESDFETFAADTGTGDIDGYTIGNSAGAGGIGLSPDAFDTCLYFIDNTGTFLEVDGYNAWGRVNGIACSNNLDNDLCSNHKKVMSLFKPVLLMTGDVTDNRIIQMNIMVCEI